MPLLSGHGGPLPFILLILLFTALAAGYRAFQPPSERERIAVLRGEVALAREAAEGCREALHERERRFRVLEEEVSGLRAYVDELESLHPDGVPEARYGEYLDAVALFNSAVSGWEPRADSLESAWARCRETVAGHNFLADSLRGLVLPEAPEGGPI